MGNLKTRLARIEAAQVAPNAGRLPMVVDDTTSRTELARMRQRGYEVLTFSEMVEHCVVELEPLVGEPAA